MPFAFSLALLLLSAPLCSSFLLQQPPPYHPSYSPAISAAIQQWDEGTLRQQIHAHHVEKVAIYADGMSAEVLDTNGLQRKVVLFPPATPVLVQDLHDAGVPFFVAPVHEPSPLVPLAQAFVMTMIVIMLIDVLGMMPAFIFGCMIVGSGLMKLSRELDELLTESSTGFVPEPEIEHKSPFHRLRCLAIRAPQGPLIAGGSIRGFGQQEYVAEGKARHDATWQSLGWPSSSEMQPQGEAIPILVDEERERDSLDL